MCEEVNKCLYCGKEFEISEYHKKKRIKKKKYCSTKCCVYDYRKRKAKFTETEWQIRQKEKEEAIKKPKAANYPEKPCIECGKLFKPRTYKTKFCSKKCRWDNKRIGKTREQIKQETIKRHTHICQGCGKQYFNKRRGAHGQGVKFCSRECAYSNQDKWNKLLEDRELKIWGEYSEIPRYTVLERTPCSRCGDLFYRHHAHELCVSCRPIVKAEKQRTSNQLSIKPRHCTHCGTYFTPLTGGGLIGFCSGECRDISDRRKKRDSKKKREAMKRGAARGETVSVIAIFNRDRWTCRVCGCDTPKALRGTLEDDAPELDHIIPISKGGTHTSDNLQCLCRVCNILKSDKDMDIFVNENKGIGGTL